MFKTPFSLPQIFLCLANPKVVDNESSNVNRAAEGYLINRCHSDKWRRCCLNHILLVVCRKYNFSRHVGSLFSTSSRTCLGITALNKMHCFNINIRPTAYSFRFLNVLHSEYHTDNSPGHQLSNRRVIIDAVVKRHHVVVAVLIQQPSNETLPALSSRRRTPHALCKHPSGRGTNRHLCFPANCTALCKYAASKRIER